MGMDLEFFIKNKTEYEFEVPSLSLHKYENEINEIIDTCNKCWGEILVCSIKRRELGVTEFMIRKV